MNLTELTLKRRNHIESCKDNNDNSHGIISSLYSDPSHFIYELLQNADDAKATKVLFRLKSNFLEFKHNGIKSFDFYDVESITAIGNSTKKDDINSIGTFGAGFKSVFAITKSPNIHSDTYHFKITDFIVPEKIQAIDSDGYTIIILPFDHPELDAENARKQIDLRLRKLEAESLLFLNNIKEIDWKTCNGNGSYIAKTEKDIVNIISNTNMQKTKQSYLVVKEQIKIENNALTLAIAYLINDEPEKSIVPIDNAKLFVFFPTNERTGFNFLVHAPYKTTPSRETIPFEDEQNSAITSKLSDLVASSIERVKENDLLDVDFLSILPLDISNNHPLYDASFEKVKNQFVENKFLPTSNGKFTQPRNALLGRGKDLIKLLNKKDCSKLFGRDYWLNEKITSDRTKLLRDYLVYDLDVPEETMSSFCDEITSEFMLSKSDSWVVNFYSIVSKSKTLYSGPEYSPGILRRKPIIRLEDGSHIDPVSEDGEIQVYLPTKIESKYKTVKKEIASNKNASEFLGSLGLKTPDKIAEIKEFVLPKYRNQETIVEESEYCKDFEGILNLWLDSDEYRQKEIADLLKGLEIIYAINQKGKTVLKKARDVYFKTDKLSSWFKGNTEDEYFFINIEDSLLIKGRSLFENIGVRSELLIDGNGEINIARDGYYRKSIYGFNPDFNIDGLDCALKNIDLVKSVYLWSVLLKYPNKLSGHIGAKTNKNHGWYLGNLLDSKALNIINATNWLFNKRAELIDKPLSEIVLDDFNENYQLENNNIEKLVKSLGLKLDIIKEFEEKTGKRVVTEEEYELLQEIKKPNVHSDNNLETDERWEPDVSPDGVEASESSFDFRSGGSEDLSNQKENTPSTTNNHDVKTSSDTKNKHETENNKDIGDWGEVVAKKYLEKKYPDHDVIWLNENNSIGKGYDFVLRKDDIDIAYFEVKSKTHEAPELIDITGTQWNWARRLFNEGKGNMYSILVVSNAGKSSAKIREILNPVECWELGKIYAHPVRLEL